MKPMQVVKIGLAVMLMLFCAVRGRGDSLDVTLTQASQTVVQGTTVIEFDATISNPSTTDTIFLNADSWMTNSTLVSVDDTPFMTNAPLYLNPGDSSGTFALFDVDLPANLAGGSYTGIFSILGGPDGGTFSDFSPLSSSAFTVNVVATPEPGTIFLIGSGLAGLGLLKKRGQRRQE
jgi:PEP-CTERM motif